MTDDRSLTEALASHGITHAPSIHGKHLLTKGSHVLGLFDAKEGWELVAGLESNEEAA